MKNNLISDAMSLSSNQHLAKITSVSKHERKRKSSSSRKRRRSTDGKKDHLIQDSASLVEERSQDNSFSVQTEIEKPKINYQDELVLIFFDSMLNNIIEEWITIPDEPVTKSFCKMEEKSESVTLKDFKDLVPKDMETMEVLTIEGSIITLTKKQKAKRKSSSSLKNKRNYSTKKEKHSNLAVNNSIIETVRRSSTKESTLIVSKISHSSSSNTDDVSTLTSGYSLHWLLNPPNENVVIKFKDGNRYEGPVSKKKMHGYGKFIWADGAVYEGNFVCGQATGKGKLEYPDLSFYNGYFCNSFLHGEGALNIGSSTMLYSGNWKAGKKHGHGWLLYSAENWYEGEWFEDRRQGMGLRYYKSGEKYKGTWYQGEQHGQGTAVWPNNDFYKGEWSKGLRQGYGEYTWNAFLNETFAYPLENIYRGSWEKGMRDGVGILIFGTEGGTRLAGIWQCNKKHGLGVLVCANGATIEKNPLFWSDKPIRLQAEHCAPCVTESSQYVMSEQEFQNPQSPKVKSRSTLHTISKQVHSKYSIKKLDSGVLLNMTKSSDVIKMIDNLNFSGESIPLHIPIHTGPELIDISHYIELIVNQYFTLNSECNETAVEECSSKWNASARRVDLSKYKSTPNSTPTDASIRLEEMKQSEEKYLRNAILANLPQLYKLYYRYASLATHGVLRFKPILVRLFLWQFLRDLHVLKRYSLIALDLLLIQNPNNGLEMKHYPFEKIYFWQFLQILLNLAWLQHDPNDITDKRRRFGILAGIFTNFLSYVFDEHFGTSPGLLFEYHNLVSINNCFSLYKSKGDPHTARQFLNNICTKKRETPPCYLKMFRDAKAPTFKRGINAIPVGENIVYLEEDPPELGQPPKQPHPEPIVNDLFCKELFSLRSLGAKKVVQYLVDICPNIAENGIIVNMDYPLSFIEFYETLLLCCFFMVDKAKKREERIRLQIEKMNALDTEEEDKVKSSKAIKDKKKSISKIK